MRGINYKVQLPQLCRINFLLYQISNFIRLLSERCNDAKRYGIVVAVGRNSADDFFDQCDNCFRFVKIVCASGRWPYNLTDDIMPNERVRMAGAAQSTIIRPDAQFSGIKILFGKSYNPGAASIVFG